MQLKPRIKHISLAFRGEGWEDAYIDLRALRVEDLLAQDETQNGSEQLRALFRKLFMGGKALNLDNQLEDLSADDIDQLDVEDLTAISKALTAPADPNA